MEINSIKNGTVIDHIRAGYGIKVLEYLKIDAGHDGCGSVALIMNVNSRKHGKKDIIKLENVENVDLDVLGLIDHNATVIHIKNDVIVDKKQLKHPQKVTDVIICKNPRCIAASDETVPHIFRLADDNGKYQCEYCDNLVNSFED
jgi:aspartate carbamoyltransferase regulatory subunit